MNSCGDSTDPSKMHCLGLLSTYLSVHICVARASINNKVRKRDYTLHHSKIKNVRNGNQSVVVAFPIICNVLVKLRRVGAPAMRWTGMINQSLASVTAMNLSIASL